jgi:hypothetical protein
MLRPCPSCIAGASLVAAASVVFALFVIPRMCLARAGILFQLAGFLVAASIYGTYWVRCHGKWGQGTLCLRHMLPLPAALQHPARVLFEPASPDISACAV